MRLTEKVNNKNCNYDIKKGCLCKALDKLGQIENTEEKLGLSLITIGKMLVKGFYVKDGSDIEEADFRGIWLEYKKIYFETQSDEGEIYFEDYGKTWALTKKELL